MYLYDKQKNKFDVYLVDERKSDIVAFRKQEIEKIPYEKRILVYKDKDSFWVACYEHYPSFAEDRLSYAIMENEETEALLENYYQGQYNESFIQKIKGRDGLRYLLDTEGKYLRDHRDLRQVTGIIELPRSLYSLQMFIQEKFDCLNGEDILQLADLFQLSKVDEISIPQLQKLDEYGFTENVYDRICQVTDAQKKVLSLIKKR